MLSKTYSAKRLSDLIVSVLGDVSHNDDLGDLSDHVVVEMEEINGLVVGDFRYTGTSIEINVEDNNLENSKVIDMLVECVESYRDYSLPIIRKEGLL